MATNGNGAEPLNKALLGGIDPFFYDGHVTVTIENGVATLRGIVFDDWDMRQAMRISRRIAGVKRVINDLDIETGGD
jgi:hypothetical protein